MAVLENLKDNGFDKDGRRMADAQKISTTQLLIGTVDIEILKKSVEVNHAEVQRQARLIVQAILEICGVRQHLGHASLG